MNRACGSWHWLSPCSPQPFEQPDFRSRPLLLVKLCQHVSRAVPGCAGSTSLPSQGDIRPRWSWLWIWSSLSPLGRRMLITCQSGQNKRAHLVQFLVLQSKRMLDCIILLSLGVAGEDLGHLRPRLLGSVHGAVSPTPHQWLVSGTEMSGQCVLFICVPSARHSAWHRAALHKCLQSTSQKPPPLVSPGDLGLALSPRHWDGRLVSLPVRLELVKGKKTI